MLDHVESLSADGRKIGEKYGYVSLGYGWPVANWAVAFWEQPVPYGRRMRVVAGIDLRGLWRRTTGREPYQAVVPVFPMLRQSVVTVAAWAVVARLVIAFRRRGQGRAVTPCAKCGYELCATPADAPCPECGAPRSPSAALTTEAPSRPPVS